MISSAQTPLQPIHAESVSTNLTVHSTTAGIARARVINQVRAICALHGIGPEQLMMFLRDPKSGGRRLSHAGELLDDIDCPELSNSDLRSVAFEVQERTGHPIPTDGLEARSVRAGRRAADVVGVLLGVTSGYIVIGGLLEGSSELLPGASGVTSFALFCVTLSVLALFEALHVSVVQLKTSDLGSLANSHPRAMRLQRQFADDLGTQRFLAGRQIVVIVTVFFVAGLASFREMDFLPLTSVGVPAFLAPLLWVGAPGAFFTLWIGQLAPQFYATRNPVKLMNQRVAEIAFRVAMRLEAAGLARPGFWISRGAPEDLKVSTSPAVRWSQAANETHGYGTVAVSRDWEVTALEATLDAITSTAFFGPDRESFSETKMMLPAGARELAHFSALMPPVQGQEKPLMETPSSDERLRSGDRIIRQTVVPRVGAIESGDVLLSAVRARYAGSVGRDAILIETPVRSLAMSVRIVGDPRFVPTAKLVAHRVGGDTTDVAEESAPIFIKPVRRSNNELVLEHSIPFPEVGTLYVMTWQVEF